jgi:Flp pilus assembly pilin Flp
MIRDPRGASMVEYVVLVVLLVGLVGGALWTLYGTMVSKLQSVNTDIGS